MRRGWHRLRVCFRRFLLGRLSWENPLEGFWLAILKDPTRLEVSPPEVHPKLRRWHHLKTGSGILHPESGGERRSQFKQVTKTMPNKAGAGNCARGLLFHASRLGRAVPDLIRSAAPEL